MINKLGHSQSFKGNIEISPNCRDKEDISKSLTPELKQKIEKELPKDQTLVFTEYGYSALKKGEYYVVIQGHLPTDEYVRKSVNKAKTVYKNVNDPEYMEKQEQKYRKAREKFDKVMNEWIEKLREFEEKNKTDKKDKD